MRNEKKNLKKMTDDGTKKKPMTKKKSSNEWFYFPLYQKQ